MTHVGATGATEVARHRLTTPGNPRIDPAHYPERTTDPLRPRPRPTNSAEAAFLGLGPGAERWLVLAAASGAERVRTKMNRATELAALVGDELVETALALAAEAGRFGDGDLESILEHLRARPAGRWAGRTPLPDAAGSLQPGTAAWEAVGR